MTLLKGFFLTHFYIMFCNFFEKRWPVALSALPFIDGQHHNHRQQGKLYGQYQSSGPQSYTDGNEQHGGNPFQHNPEPFEAITGKQIINQSGSKQQNATVAGKLQGKKCYQLLVRFGL